MIKKISVTTTSFAQYDLRPLDLLKKAGFSVILNNSGKKLKKKETLKLCRDSLGIIVGTEEYDREILRGLKNLKVISRCGTGTENIDIKAAKDLGIRVMNTPDVPVEAVAELTVGLILAFYRKIPKLDKELKAGAWSKTMGGLVLRKTLGVVGLGRIGKRVVELMAPFKMKVLSCEILPDQRFVRKSGIKIVSLTRLLKEADIITLHLPYNRKKKHLIGKRELAMMKPGAVLVNTSRGGIIDEGALVTALRSRKIQGACLDVFRDEPYTGPLRKLENVILTPHIGSYAKEARVRMEIEATQNLINSLKRRKR